MISFFACPVPACIFMGTRRQARESALQFLFQDDFAVEGFNHGDDLKEPFQQFCELYQINRKARKYTLAILKGIYENKQQIDSLITENATNWRLERISPADRNTLRIAVYEMKYCEDVPLQVAMNEAVEVAKRFGSDESPAFVNGILDAVRKTLEQ